MKAQLLYVKIDGVFTLKSIGSFDREALEVKTKGQIYGRDYILITVPEYFEGGTELVFPLLSQPIK